MRAQDEAIQGAHHLKKQVDEMRKTVKILEKAADTPGGLVYVKVGQKVDVDGALKGEIEITTFKNSSIEVEVD